MGMIYAISYHEEVARTDIPRLSSLWRIKIKTAIEQRLTIEPLLYSKPLRSSLKNYRKLRVGDYRIVFRIEKDTVTIILIAHRSIVYTYAERRVS